MTRHRHRCVALAALAVAILAVAWFGLFAGDPSAPVVEVNVPQLSTAARQGKALFEANCVQCHGRNAAGSGNGPPLVHIIYEPGHHADFAFVSAVRNGVRAHHWHYGDMPPVPGLNEQEIALITRYVRELQRANDIQ